MGQAMEKPHVVHYELRHSNSTTDITTEERRPKEKSANIIKLIMKQFQQHQKVTESGLIAYQGLCYGMKEKIQVA